jgi:hypothetical protein
MVEVARIDAPYRLRRSDVPLLANANTYGARLWPLDSRSREIIPVPGASSCCDGVVGASRQPFDVGYDRVLLVDPETGEQTRIARSEGSDSISAAAFTADLGRVYVAERETEDRIRVPGAVRLSRVPDGATLAEVRPDATIAKIIPIANGGSAVLLGTPGGWIVKGAYERGWIWQPNADRLIALETEGGPIGTAEVSPNGSFLAIGYGVTEIEQERWRVRGRPRVVVRDLDTGDTVLEAALEKPPADIAFSRDGRLMVVRDSFDFVAFDTGTWTELRRARAEHGWTNGRTAILANEWIMVPDQKGLRMVSMLSGKDIFLPERDGNPQMSFAADDRTFALESGNIVSVWRLEDRREGESRVRQMARFGPVDSGSRTMFAGSEGKLYITGRETLRRALYEPAKIEADVCRRIGRGLTDEELAAHFAEGGAKNPCVRQAP